MGPRGTPALTFSHVFLLRTTLSFLLIKNVDKMCNGLPDMPFWDNLNNRPLCHTLSKALEISRKTFLTSWPSSNDVTGSYVRDNNWLIQESPGLNPDWFCEMRLFPRKKSNSSLKK